MDPFRLLGSPPSGEPGRAAVSQPSATRRGAREGVGIVARNSWNARRTMQVFLQTLVGGLSLGAIYALVAMGFSLVYRTMGLVNFAHGNVVMIGAYLASTFFLSTKLPFAVAMVVAMAVTGLIGIVIERVLRPLENKDFDLMLIGTIGFGIVLEALAIIIWGATGRAVPSPVPAPPLEFVGLRVRTYDLIVLGVAAAATAALMLFLQRTKRGAAMQ